MKIAIRHFSTGSGAMSWIYGGYYRAFQELGHEVIYFTHSSEVNGADIIFDYISPDSLQHKNYGKMILFVSPNYFPGRWNDHVNYVSPIAKDPMLVSAINENSKILKWTFYRPNKFWDKWNDVHYFPLAFDNLSYKHESGTPTYDVFYCGGWANNGYNSKKKRIIEYLSQFKDKPINPGFFVNKNLSHDKENLYLSTSKVCINIHDDYQEILGLDTNERTFKALGLNGCLVSDNVEELETLNLPVAIAKSPEEMYEKVLELLDMDESVKKSNREMILEEHCYINRTKGMLECL